MGGFQDVHNYNINKTKVLMYDEAIRVAASLASEDGENSEYDRGMAELIGDLFVDILDPEVYGEGLDVISIGVMEDIRKVQN